MKDTLAARRAKRLEERDELERLRMKVTRLEEEVKKAEIQLEQMGDLLKAACDQRDHFQARVVELEALCAKAAVQGCCSSEQGRHTVGVLWTTWQQLEAAGRGERIGDAP